MAALISALLLQATVLGPAALPIPASLPAVLVAAIALVDGPGAGVAFGFAAGLVADLASEHPAGVLALGWLGLGLSCGRFAAGPGARRSRRADALLAGAAAAATTVACDVGFVLLGADGATLGATARLAVWTLLLDVALALPVVALVRPFLRSATLRLARPVLVLGGPALAERPDWRPDS